MRQTHEIRPNLFIIGAAKSGTTSLHDYLTRHPDIFMSEPKEPCYFTPGVAHYPTNTEWYLSLFRGAGDAKFVGESSTHYTKLPKYPGVVERIADFCDDPLFIYLMRDPIDRIISQYWHRIRQEVHIQDMLTTIKREFEFMTFSDYAMQLEELRQFGALPNEFTIDPRTGRRSISSSQSLERLMADYPSGLVVVERQQWQRARCVARDAAEFLLSHADAVELPERRGFLAFQWQRPHQP